MKRVKIVSVSLGVSFILITVIGLPTGIWLWSFLGLVIVSMAYFLCEFSLLLGRWRR